MTCIECGDWVSYSARDDMVVHFGCLSDWKRKNGSYRPDGTWGCIMDHRTTPCGECPGCLQVQAQNRFEGRP